MMEIINTIQDSNIRKTVEFTRKDGIAMDPFDIGIDRAGVTTGRSLASLSKEEVKFFDATDNAKKKLQKRCHHFRHQ